MVLVVVNPAAGRARGAKLREEAWVELKRLFADAIFVESESPGHATRLAAEATDAQLVVAVGGDGTVREVAAGVLNRPAAVAVVPTGSGNDFCKTFGLPLDVKAACRLAREGVVRPIDAARISAVDSPGEPRLSGSNPATVFVNAAGLGFDADVVAEAKKLKHLHGLPLYLLAVFRAIQNYRGSLARITVDGRTWEQRFLLLAVANCRYYGGGMKIAPEAQPDDGLLDVCLIDAVNRPTIVRRLPRFIKGTHVRLREVRMFRTRKLELSLLEPCPIQVDGDIFGPEQARYGLRLLTWRIEALPAALRLVTPPRSHSHTGSLEP